MIRRNTVQAVTAINFHFTKESFKILLLKISFQCTEWLGEREANPKNVTQ